MSNGFDVNKIEEKILTWWAKRQIFERSVERRKGQKPFVFFEGPPTANGQPGIHHFLGRAIKDLFCRYKTMQGFYVERKSGWDTHGLPVEIEVEKELGLKSKKEIENYGIARFNAQAQKSVWKYKDEWERFTKRIGFWLDLKDSYVTSDASYVETLWWIIKKMGDKKLLFRGHKVVPFCTRCGTSLSSHEVAQGYRTVTDQAVTVKFLISNSEFLNKFQVQNPNLKTYILAWTTTPWTLPGNVALAVGEKIKYVLVKFRDHAFILAKDRLAILPLGGEILKEFSGKDLVGLEYEPPFEVKKLKSSQSYKIYPADFVTTKDGTGVVHTAVMYGEDDYNLGLKVKLPRHHTVDQFGKFTADVPELEGKFVKDVDAEIIDYLRKKDLLFGDEPFEHDYPFCWRCDQPLLYYAMDSWFIGMSKLEKALRRNNAKINWYPGHLREGRFGEWLKGVKDWAFSRERYWGTPLPIWECAKHREHRLVAGSFQDLEKFRFKKKNQYFLMRHGFSTKNGDGIISSRLANDHYPLTKGGRIDVAKEAKRLKKIGVDVIFSSPFLRTKETAEIISDLTGVKVCLDERLRDIDHGSECEGADQVRCLPEGLTHPPHLDFKFGDGESWNDTRKRVMEFIREVDSRHEGKNIVVVGHGDPLAVLAGTMLGWSDEELLKILRGDGRSLEKEGQHPFYPRKGKFYVAHLFNWPWDERGYLDPHRPYVDEIILRCPQCSEKMNRIKEVADVWFDSGAMPYAQWHYPFENKTKFHKNFPAEFIAEAIDQTRGWFYTLLAISTLLDRGPAYKNVIAYGHVLDEQGQKMSKSKGNVVDPWDIMAKYGADATRWYFYSVNHPGESKLFSAEEVALCLRGMMMTLWNSFRFFELYNRDNREFPVNFHKTKPDNALDTWLMSRLHQTIRQITEALDRYDATMAARTIERFMVEDFSRWWLRRSRHRFQRPEHEDAGKTARSFLRFFLLEVVKLMAPFTPFMAEYLHHKLHRGSSAGTASVHWHDWPKADKSKIDLDLEKEMTLVQRISNVGLGIRQKEKIKVRQPLKTLVIGDEHKLRSELVDLLKDELNVKEIIADDTSKLGATFVVEEAEGLKVGLDMHVDQALKFEGWAREIIRQIQDMRKEAEYHFSDRIFGQWHTDNEELKKAVEQWAEFIKQNSLLKEFLADATYTSKIFDIQKEFELAPGQKIWLGLKK